MTAELLIDTNKIEPDEWQTFEKFELTQLVLWEHPETGASITLLDFPKGSGIPTKHSHASNQFMYCLKGRYEYTDSNLELTPGCFYSNPKDHAHGPTIAHERSVLIEVYDGPHYYEMPDYHTDSTIGRIQEDADKSQNTYLVVARSAQSLPDTDNSLFQAHQAFISGLTDKPTSNFNAVLGSDDDSDSSGVSYLVRARDVASARATVNRDPFCSLYSDIQVQRIRT